MKTKLASNYYFGNKLIIQLEIFGAQKNQFRDGFKLCSQENCFLKTNSPQNDFFAKWI